MCGLILKKLINTINLILKKSIIEFKNGDIIEFDVSIGSLTNQIMRASRLKIHFRRKNK